MTPLRESTDIVRRDDYAVARNQDPVAVALAAQERAMVEARIMVAIRNRRSWDDVRQNMMKLCRDSEFCAEALYVKPISRAPEGWADLDKRERLLKAPEEWPTGFSIRFLEAVIYEAGNIDVQTIVLAEDEQKRVTRVGVWDIESNNAYWRVITTPKTVERRKIKQGQTPLATRENSYGDTVYIIQATDAEVSQSEAASVSKAIRTLAEKLLPPHYKQEWKRKIWDTLANSAMSDPEGTKKKILDAFADKGILPSMIERYLGHPVSASTPGEYVNLRGIYMAICEGVATWKDVMALNEQPEEGEKPTAAKLAILEKIEAQKKKQQDDTVRMKTEPAGSAPQPAADATPKPAEPAQEAPKPSTATPEPTGQQTSQKPQETASGKPPIITYAKGEMPAPDDLKLGTECIYEGVLYRVIEEPGEFPKWQTMGSIGLTGPAGEPPKAETKKGKRERHTDALSFE